MGGSSSKSSTSTEYKTQNISSPGNGNTAGGNITIYKDSQPALLIAGKTTSQALATSEKAIKLANSLSATSMGMNTIVATQAIKGAGALSVNTSGVIAKFAGKAIDSNVANTNIAMGAISNMADLNYKRSTNQAQNLQAITTRALNAVSQASRTGATINTGLLIKTIGIVGGLIGGLYYLIGGKK